MEIQTKPELSRCCSRGGSRGTKGSVDAQRQSWEARGEGAGWLFLLSKISGPEFDIGGAAAPTPSLPAVKVEAAAAAARRRTRTAPRPRGRSLAAAMPAAIPCHQRRAPARVATAADMAREVLRAVVERHHTMSLHGPQLNPAHRPRGAVCRGRRRGRRRQALIARTVLPAAEAARGGVAFRLRLRLAAEQQLLLMTENACRAIRN